MDGFNAALRLKKESKKYFDLLTKYSSRFEFKGKKNVHLKSCFPMIALSPGKKLTAKTALSRFGIWRLAAVIHTLRNTFSMNIDTDSSKGYAIYSISSK